VTVFTALISAFAAAILTTWFSLWRFRQERWWEKKYEVYASIINSLHALYRGFDTERFLPYDDGLMGSIKSPEHIRLENQHKQFETAKLEIKRIVTIGDFILSEDAVKELETLLSKFVMPTPNEQLDTIAEIGQAIETCLTRIRQLAKNDLNPSVVRAVSQFVRVKR
jgi:hypothetical protein